MLKAVGFSDADLKKPLIGVANTWIEIGPCNYHLRDLAVHVKAGIRAAGGTPMEFNTVSISDGITMGTEGMRASLVSREVIADSIELVTRGNGFDGLVVLVGCDKTIPGGVMALARLNIPGVLLYGGSIAPGHFHDQRVTIQDVFEAVGAHAAGAMSDAELCALEAGACPGAGACGGQFTANTMAIASEFLGIAALGSGSVPANDPKKADVARAAGERVMDLVRSGVRPRDIITRTALENAIASVATTGGSTNAVLHLIAIAREAGVELDARRFRSHQRAHAAAGRTSSRRAASSRPICTRPAAARWSRSGWSRRARSTARRRRSPAGRSAAEAAEAVETRGQEVVRPIGQPLKKSGGLVILHGSLAPEGAVMKVSGTERMQHRGPARVFDSEEAAFDAVQRQTIKAGDVVVIRYEGPSGGPGMREMLGVTGAIVGAGLGDTVALITDGRFSGATRGFWSATSRPKRRAAARWPPSATATSIVIDVAKPHARRRVSATDELKQRLADVAARRRRATRPACSRNTRGSSRRRRRER